MVGVLNLYKPSGPTSHDVVARVRRVLGVRRVGHTGTLDPMARGVLVVCVGSATRIVEYFTVLRKEYRARMILGIETDTQDVTGTVTAEHAAGHVREEELRAVLPRFRGEIMQTPPMVSAVKHEGRRLYQLARAGQEVERAPRPVTVYDLECHGFEPGPRPEAEIAVTCSGGTYVRTLCADIGSALGVGGVLADLERVAIGPFRSEESLTLERLEALAAEGRAGEALTSPADALAHLPAITVDEADCLALAQGKSILTSPPAPPRRGEGSWDEIECSVILALPPRIGEGAGGRGPIPIRILDPDGVLVGIGRIDTRDGQTWLAPEKVFRSAS